MNVSYSMVRGLYTSVSSTAPSHMVGARTSLHVGIDTLSQEKSCLEQSIMPLNSRYF